jgi:hypothetical protein
VSCTGCGRERKWSTSWVRAGMPKENEEVARRVGFEPFPTVEAALEEAEDRLGKNCTITYHPRLEEQTYFTRVHANGH